MANDRSHFVNRSHRLRTGRHVAGCRQFAFRGTQAVRRDRFYTSASGVAEVGTGALLLAPSTRRLGGWAAAALFLAVFPANINMVRLWWDKPWPMKLGAIARLPLQIPMVTAALRVARAER